MHDKKSVRFVCGNPFCDKRMSFCLSEIRELFLGIPPVDYEGERTFFWKGLEGVITGRFPPANGECIMVTGILLKTGEADMWSATAASSVTC
ncbi:hypothetical protein [Methanogenium cariaci]|uniref:hypothetical protein n=1 Tax=Methanogenium cariaci TaxID=2197 RepID=UPI0012F6F39C|nr:hypothetical protein [Methanogenium cariaci]